MFETCRGCDTADLFHFDAYIEGPPWGLRMSLIKTQAQPFWALVRLLSCFSMDLQYLSCTRGGEGYSIHFRVPGGDGEPFTLAVDASWQKFGATGTNVFLRITYYANRLGSGCASAAGGRLYVLCDAAKY